ncbi:MAG: trehalose-phosphatase [Candidatus Zixiibacteriota bacterium]|nr:MAG: trehalose-phosphatase [candidate division Zixibacteria bacterium]
MKLLNSQFDLEGFYSRLSSATERLLMLDYDGTLAPFTTDRDCALPYPEIAVTLKRLYGSDRARVVIISGRTVDALKKLLGSDDLPELWGCHGLERYTSEGQYWIVELPEEMRQKLSELYNWTAEENLVNFCEFKPSGGAFHWRGLPADEADLIRDKVIGRWEGVAQSSDLELLAFDGGVEIRVAGTNKANPVDQLLLEANNETVLAYLGDDLTDEDAFRALKGRGLGVLVRGELRDTEADLWLEPPDELKAFLERWL